MDKGTERGQLVTDSPHSQMSKQFISGPNGLFGLAEQTPYS